MLPGRAYLLLIAVGAVACSTYTIAGFEVEVDARSPGLAGTELLQIRNDLGFAIELSRGYLVTSSLELVSCPAQTARSWPRLSLIGIAEAHVPGSPTRIGAPLIERLPAGDDPPAPLGTLRPPPGSYCRVRMRLAPADGDARGLPADARVVGRTLYLLGQYRSPGGTDDHPLAVVSSDAVDVEVPVTPVVLTEDATPRRRTLVVDKAADHWFDGIDLDALPAAELGSRLLANIAASVKVGPR